MDDIMKTPVYKLESHSPDGRHVLAYVESYENALCFAKAWSGQENPQHYCSEKYTVEGGWNPGYAEFIDDMGFVCVVSGAPGQEALFVE